MASQKTKFTVGLFVTCGFAIGLLAFVWLGMSKFLEEGRNYVTFFNESVQGLDIDSPVKYRGVSIGRVEHISVAPDSKLIQVILKIDSGQKLSSDLIAQLKSVGITGSMFVEMDKIKKGERIKSPKLSFPTENPIISSKPSDISQLFEGVDDLLGQIRSIDLAGISDRIKISLDSLNQMIADANIKGTSENLNEMMSQAELSLKDFQSIVTDNRAAINSAISDLSRATKNANVLMEKGTDMMSGTDESIRLLQHQLLVAGQNLETASESLNRLMETVSSQPSQLLFSEPPKAKKIDK